MVLVHCGNTSKLFTELTLCKLCNSEELNETQFKQLGLTG